MSANEVLKRIKSGGILCPRKGAFENGDRVSHLVISRLLKEGKIERAEGMSDRPFVLTKSKSKPVGNQEAK
jgi:hypothetical protein